MRALRGQATVYSSELDVPAENQIIGDTYDRKKSVYVVAYMSGGAMQDKIRRICNSFNNELLEVNLDTLGEMVS